MKNIIMVGESPEQIVHGISISNKMIFEVIRNNAIWLTEKNQFSSPLIRRLTKLPNSIRLWVNLIFIKLNRGDVFYSSLAISTLGLLKSISLASIMRAKGATVIFHIHRGDFVSRLSSSGSLYRTLAELVFKLSDTIIVLSEAQKNEISSFFSGTVEVLANTIEVEVPPKAYTDKACSFLYLSNLIKEKGYRDLISVFCDTELKKLNLILAGTLSTTDDLRFISELSQKNIEYFGPVSGERKNEILKNADCFVLPSYNEGQPISILEAMSRGVIVIATDVGCIKEMLPENYPFLFTPGDTKALRRHVISVSSMGMSELEALSKSLKKKYSDSYSKNLFGKNVKTIFRI